MTYCEARAAIEAQFGQLPGGAMENATMLMMDYDYPIESAVARALDWTHNSQRIQALGLAQ